MKHLLLRIKKIAQKKCKAHCLIFMSRAGFYSQRENFRDYTNKIFSKQLHKPYSFIKMLDTHRYSYIFFVHIVYL
uniref:Uncharacterized protein n=1 Tax=Kuenenia stuttgartiensis TaxID=174633 RepID=Q1PZW2_KUEST|nr:unknown protein [Candidatus Kuenenia stuttgartiensis]